MATLANRDSYSAVSKVLGVCFAVGAFFSVLDAIRNPIAKNFTSVCFFGFASWVLLTVAARAKRPGFAMTGGSQALETIVGWKLGAPSWVRLVVWISLFLLLLALVGELVQNRSALHLSPDGLKLASMSALGAYLFACPRLEHSARLYLRARYPDAPQVSINAAGLWVTGTHIPWTSIRAIMRQTRNLNLFRVDTIVVRALAAKRSEDIEIDLSESVEDPQALYAKLRSAAEAHGAKLLPEGHETRSASRKRVREARERARASREKLEQLRASLPREIANTEVRLQDAKSKIAQTEAKLAELRAALESEDCPREQIERQIELAEASLRSRLALRDSTEKLLASQRKALATRR